jgi:hypothetical protein
MGVIAHSLLCMQSPASGPRERIEGAIDGYDHGRMGVSSSQEILESSL